MKYMLWDNIGEVFVTQERGLSPKDYFMSKGEIEHLFRELQNSSGPTEFIVVDVSTGSTFKLKAGEYVWEKCDD